MAIVATLKRNFIGEIFNDMRKRGRPRKEIDKGVMFHMIKNNAPVTHTARFLGVHRDTLYTNYASVIKEARESHTEAWRKVITPWIEEILRKKKEKQKAKMPKRKYRPRGLHPSFWRP